MFGNRLSRERVAERTAAPQAPPAALRAGVERLTGVPLHGVRLHVGTEAERAAAGVDATAFAAGRDVYFGRGAYSPGTAHGDHLIAHELTHVAQQRAVDVAPGTALPVGAADGPAERQAEAFANTVTRPGAAATASRAGEGAHREGTLLSTPPRIARTLAQVQTKGTALDLTEMAKWQAADYWSQKVFEVYDVTTIGVNRFATNTEERDAVLSLVWAEHLKLRQPLASASTVVISVPARSASTKAVAYRLAFSPPAKKGDKPGLGIQFLAEGAGATAATGATPSGGPAMPSSWSESGFPDGGLTAYAQAHPDEVGQLFAWMNASAPTGAFTQLVHTTGTGKTTHHSTFLLKGSKSDTGVSNVVVTLVDQMAPVTASTAAGYDAKDMADLELERVQRGKAGLGTVTGIDTLPADERLPAKFAVWQYFQGGTRNAEVDAIVPIPGATRRVLLTLRFSGTTNDVSVERIGEEGKDATLDPTTRKMDVRRVRGFNPAADGPTLKSWISTRLPGVKPAGTTPPDLIASVNQTMEADAGTPAWFKANYTLDVLDGTSGEQRLTSVHGMDKDQTVDTKSFSTGELRLVEFALQRLSDAELTLLRGVALVRQRVKIDKATRQVGKKTVVSYTENPSVGGFAQQSGANRTVSLFDAMAMNDATLFIGGRSGSDVSAAPMSAMTVLHELGHLTGFSAKIQEAFDARFVAAKAKLHTAPVTWYAKTGSGEFFPEAFAIYNADPQWMQTNLPDMFAWFETLAKTGSPPP